MKFITKREKIKYQIVFRSADELLNYTKSEEEHNWESNKEIYELGVKFIVTRGAISNIAIHYLDRFR